MVTGGGYPLPPLDLKVPKAPKRRPAVAKPAAEPHEPAAVAASSTPKEASDGDS
jgi:NADH-quinone oxidoreductase subunit H